MKVLVTGAKGFIGKNLVANLKNVRDHKDRSRDVVIDEIFEYDIDTPKELFEQYCADCDFVFNLAGINRPQNAEEFNINHSFLAKLLETLKKHGNNSPVMLSSSTQALLDNDYGK
jgi:UDP-2-acetamido-2,6-beta-L-arabino-hexul-4-ose reductase